jgi:hypothetical protein
LLLLHARWLGLEALDNPRQAEAVLIVDNGVVNLRGGHRWVGCPGSMLAWKSTGRCVRNAAQRELVADGGGRGTGRVGHCRLCGCWHCCSFLHPWRAGPRYAPMDGCPGWWLGAGAGRVRRVMSVGQNPAGRRPPVEVALSATPGRRLPPNPNLLAHLVLLSPLEPSRSRWTADRARDRSLSTSCFTRAVF